MIAIAAMTNVAEYDRNEDFAREYPEPDVTLDAANPGREPDTFTFPRQPFAGIRAVVTRLTHNVMPGIPQGPAAVVATRTDIRQGRRAANPMSTPAVYAPVNGVNQTSAWWEGGELY